MIVHCNGIFIPRKHSGALLMCAWLPQLITYVHIFGRKCIKDIGYVQYFVLKCVLSLLQIMKLPMNYSVPPSTKGRHPAPFSIKPSMNLSKPLSLVLPTQWEKHWMKSGGVAEDWKFLCPVFLRWGAFEDELSPWMVMVSLAESETDRH